MELFVIRALLAINVAAPVVCGHELMHKSVVKSLLRFRQQIQHRDLRRSQHDDRLPRRRSVIKMVLFVLWERHVKPVVA